MNIILPNNIGFWWVKFPWWLSWQDQAAQSHKQKTKLNQQRHEWIEQVPKSFFDGSETSWTWVWVKIIGPLKMFCNDSVSTKTNRNCGSMDAVHGFVLKVGRPLQVFFLRFPIEIATNIHKSNFETTRMMLHSTKMILLNWYLLYFNDIDALPIQQLVCVTGPDRTSCFPNCSNKIWIILLYVYIIILLQILLVLLQLIFILLY